MNFSYGLANWRIGALAKGGLNRDNAGKGQYANLPIS